MSFNSIKFDFINNYLKTNAGKNLVLSGLLPPLNLFLIKSIIEQNKKVLYIVPTEQEALKLQKDFFSLLSLESEVFPFQEIDFYSQLEKNYYIYQEQINILQNSPNVVFISTKALLEKFPSPDFYLKHRIELEKNQNVDYSKIAKILIEFGYKRVTQVCDVGEFALRGDILDIFSLNQNPIRIEFFADTIEDIRFFNPNTQKSFKSIDKTTIFPIYKFILDDDKKEKFIKKIEEKTKNDDENLILDLKNQMIESLSQIGYFEGIEYYINYFSSDQVSILDYFKDYILIFGEKSEVLSKYQNLDKTYTNNYQEALKSNLKLPLEGLNHLTYEDFSSKIKNYKRISLDNFLVDDYDKLIEFDLSLAPFFNSDIKEASKFIKKHLNQNYRIYICSNYPNRLKELFLELEIFSDDIFYYPDISSGGVICDDERIASEKILFLSDREFFNKHNRDITAKKYYSNKQTQDYIDSINDIKIGEYVVHQIHGIGIYQGITKQTIDDNQKDYLEIQFQGSDKLYMPAEQINLLVRYRGSGNQRPKLSKMGGSAWSTTKTKAKKELELVAYDLLDLYAKRKIAKGIEFEVDTTWQYEMEDNFEYSETRDQMKAIIDVKKDMESSKPMDRLICADVGFGKTEIALRAIFKAIMSGYQAAFIAPTTILTMQHYQTLKERFEPFNVQIALLNRFCSNKEQKAIIEKINNGSIDVVVGTHRLLSEDIKFKKLGFLVVDEEHKFGVRHKEKLKKFRENIDVLTLSATPIPRTLNMALSGLKDLSVINTPPKNRLPIKTYVGEFSPKFIKNAINQELSREGQVFYLYNRVETIEKFKQKLQEIVPSARIAIAHGQMNEKTLEEVVCKFINYEFDILLSTTIIESGVDIPRANTIIIHDAQNFGLAQLYQLRGRVGRSDKQAYCFCFYEKSKELSELARKRLNSIKDFTSLGSGYKIALRDIEIRGVGSILGTHQHGQMINVGFDTYCNLLSECIEDIRKKESKDPYNTTEQVKKEPTIVDINIDAYIPDEWAQTYEQKILEYKRLSDVSSLSELEEAKLNFKDRFSSIPPCVENLIKLIKLRILATSANISLVRSIGNVIRIYSPYTMQEWIILKSKIDSRITRYFTFSTPPKNLKNTKGILLMNKNEEDFEEIFNKLADLFYYISEVVLNFKASN